jgi:Raf kinase inhibitor-like YbhB/YbcL family protein
MADLAVRSIVFENNKQIPKKFSCDGEEVNPPLTIEGIPAATKTLALIIDDPDAPRGTFDHWIVYDIPPSPKIEENRVPGTQGMNSANQLSYIGMCPPSGTQ